MPRKRKRGYGFRRVANSLEEKVMDVVSTPGCRPNGFLLLALTWAQFLEKFPTPEEQRCFSRLFPEDYRELRGQHRQTEQFKRQRSQDTIVLQKETNG